MLVNDFGAINIDAKLVVGVEGETVSLANGCLCCSIRDDLIAACLGLLGRAEPPEILLIETSGVSDPVQVANSVLQPELQGLLSLGTVLAVVDAEQFPALGDEMAGLARAQVQAADLVLVNKVDLVGREGLDRVKALIRDIARGSRIVETSHGQAPLDLVLGAPAGDTWRLPQPKSQSSPAHDHVFSTWHWTDDRPLSLPKLRAVLDSLPDTIYRAKGIVYLEELPAHRVVLQVVGKRYNLRDRDLWRKEVPKSEIVLIGAGRALDGLGLARALDACVGEGDEAASPVSRLARKIAHEQSQWT